MYLLRVQSEFHAAHFLKDYPGDCRRLHGHTWRAEAEFAFQELDPLGMATDFRRLKQTLKDILPDHVLINEVYLDMNPTAENLARVLFEQMRARVPQTVAVTVWETPKSSCRYEETGSRC